MPPDRSVLIGLRRDIAEMDGVREHLETWVQGYGFEIRSTVNPREAMAWAHGQPFAASFVDAGWEVARGQALWRVLQPLLAQRMVLMTRAGRTELWSEALRCGIAAVLPLPPEPSSVRAALRAAAGEFDPPLPPREFGRPDRSRPPAPRSPWRGERE